MILIPFKYFRVCIPAAEVISLSIVFDNYILVITLDQGSLDSARRAAGFVRGDDVLHKIFTELAYRYKCVNLSPTLLPLLTELLLPKRFIGISTILLTEIEMVDTQDCYVLAFELVMLLLWPISSITCFFFVVSFCYI